MIIDRKLLVSLGGIVTIVIVIALVLIYVLFYGPTAPPDGHPILGEWQTFNERGDMLGVEIGPNEINDEQKPHDYPVGTGTDGGPSYRIIDDHRIRIFNSFLGKVYYYSLDNGVLTFPYELDPEKPGGAWATKNGFSDKFTKVHQ